MMSLSFMYFCYVGYGLIDLMPTNLVNLKSFVMHFMSKNFLKVHYTLFFLSNDPFNFKNISSTNIFMLSQISE